MVREAGDRVGAGWYPDASQPGRERWWDGEHWTARVVETGDEGIAWAASILEQPPPVVSVVDGELVIDLTGVGEVDESDGDPTQTMVVLYGGAPGVTAPSRFAAPAPQSFGPVIRFRPVVRLHETPMYWRDVLALRQKPPRRRRRLVAAAAAVLILLGAAAAGVALLDSRAASDAPAGPVSR